MKTFTAKDILNYEYDGLDWDEYPKFNGVWISKAWFREDVRELNDAELDFLNDNLLDEFIEDISIDAQSSAIDRAMD